MIELIVLIAMATLEGMLILSSRMQRDRFNEAQSSLEKIEKNQQLIMRGMEESLSRILHSGDQNLWNRKH